MGALTYIARTFVLLVCCFSHTYRTKTLARWKIPQGRARPAGGPLEANPGDAHAPPHTTPDCSRGRPKAHPPPRAGGRGQGSNAHNRKPCADNHCRCHPPPAPCNVRQRRAQKAYADDSSEWCRCSTARPCPPPDWHWASYFGCNCDYDCHVQQVNHG